MEKIKAFIKKNGKTILYIIALICLSIGFVLIELPNISVDVRVEHNTKSTYKY